MLGAPDSLATEVEKLLREEGMEPAMRAVPTEAERQAAAATRREGWNRSCLEAVLKLRLTADMVTVVDGKEGKTIERMEMLDG